MRVAAFQRAPACDDIPGTVRRLVHDLQWFQNGSYRSVRNLQARARETGCWVVSSDVVGIQEAALSHGCTCFVNPDGVIVARVPERAEGVIVHDID